MNRSSHMYGDRSWPSPRIGCAFQLLQNSSQSLLISSSNSVWSNQIWRGRVGSRSCGSSSLVKNALHLWANWVPISTQSHSIRVLRVELPLESAWNRKNKKERLTCPTGMSLDFDCSLEVTFSPPWSPQTREGSPCSFTAFKKRLSTVDAVLLPPARSATICELISD